jgi:hypothetical protein
MRSLLLSGAVIAGAICGGLMPAVASPLTLSVANQPNVDVTPVKKVGYWRRLYRHGYGVPYVYYPPAYSYAPPPGYAYYPPAYGYDARPPTYTYPPAQSYEAPPPENDESYESAPPESGDYAEHPPVHGYEAPAPEGGS